MGVCLTVLLAVLMMAPRLGADEPTALTLGEAVRLAISRHQDVAKARTAAEALKGKTREVRAQALPDIKLESNAMRWRDPSLLNASGLDNFPADLRAALVPAAVN